MGESDVSLFCADMDTAGHHSYTFLTIILDDVTICMHYSGAYWQIKRTTVLFEAKDKSLAPHTQQKDAKFTCPYCGKP